MPASLTLFPRGNADTALIRLVSDEIILLDYANVRNLVDPTDKRIDLPNVYRDELASAE